MTWRRWTVLFDLLRVGLRKPAALVGALRMENVRTLLYAVRHEPPSLILYNFGQLLGNKIKTKLHPEKRQFELEGITIYLEHLLQLPRRIEIKGWIYSPEEMVSGVQLHGDEHCVGEIKTGLDRPDLEQRYGRQFAKAGFHGLFGTRGSVALWKIVIVKPDGVSIPFPIPDYSAESRYQEWTLIDRNFRLTPRQILRRLKKSGNPRLKVMLAMTTEQRAQLNLDKLPCTILNVAEEPEQVDLVIRLHPDTIPQSDLIWQVLLSFEKSDRKVSLVYWDEDYISDEGFRTNPIFKPRWNADYLLSWNYIGQDFAYRPTKSSSAIDHPIQVLGGHRQPRAAHLPFILSHRTHNRQEDSEREKNVRTEYCQKINPKILVDEGSLPTTFRIRYPIENNKGVTIIVPFRDKPDLLRRCIESVEKFTVYPAIKWLLVNNQSKQIETNEYLESLKMNRSDVEFLSYPDSFNFAHLHNISVERITTPYVLLMNNDIEALHTGWLEAMMEHAQRPEVGAVGAMLLYPDKTIQHAGVLVGIGGAADHAFKYLPADASGYENRAQVVQQLSAITAACMLMRTDVFKQINGMDDRHFSVTFNDVDMCLKLREIGYTIIYTPHARLIHKESATRGLDLEPDQRDRARREIRAFQDKWGGFLKEGDPFYHPMLSISSGHYLFRG